jgi:hypothetical protein
MAAVLRRNNVNDFLRDVGARTGVVVGNVIAATLNADNTTYSIARTTSLGVTTVLYSKVFYPGGSGPGGAQTDANPSGDKVTIFSPDGTASVADAGVFINSLT